MDIWYFAAAPQVHKQRNQATDQLQQLQLPADLFLVREVFLPADIGGHVNAT